MEDRYAANRRGLLPVVGIVGPTSAGKTALAVQVGLRVSAEVVSADSRQVYRYMDIGTGKPSKADRALVRHHLVDVVDPDQDFNVAFFQEQAKQAILEVHRRGRIPIIVGGTGHYVWSLLEGLRLPQVEPNQKLRRELETLAQRDGGIDQLLEQLVAIDPVSGARIDRRNIRRVIRAIEVTRATGRPFSEVGRRIPPPYRVLVLGLTMNRHELYSRIDRRVERMVQGGWVDEVRRLRGMGYDSTLPSMTSLGYREICGHLAGDLGLPETVERIKVETHRFARRQYGWFRVKDPRIRWLEPGDDISATAETAIRDFLG